MSEASSNAIDGIDSEPASAEQLAMAMAAINPIERLLFARAIRRNIQSPKYRWMQAVNALGVATTTRAVMAGRWSVVAVITGLLALGLFSQRSVGDKAVGIVSAAVCALALISYLARMGEFFQAASVRRRR